MTTPTPAAIAATLTEAQRLELWFFRDCNEGTRRCLFAAFGYPVEEIRTIHREREVFRDILARLAVRAHLENPHGR